MREHKIYEVAEQIESLVDAGFDFDGIRAFPDGNYADRAGKLTGWDELTKGQQRAVLERYVGWTGFTPKDIEHAIKNVLTDRPKREWFDGVQFHGPDDSRVYTEWLADVSVKGYGLAKRQHGCETATGNDAFRDAQQHDGVLGGQHALRSILQGDYSKQQEIATQKRGGREM